MRDKKREEGVFVALQSERRHQFGRQEGEREEKEYVMRSIYERSNCQEANII